MKVGPVVPSSIEVELVDDSGQPLSNLDGQSGEFSAYDYRDLKMSYNVSVSGSVMTVTLDQEQPDMAGLYTVEILLDDTGIRGWLQNKVKLSEQSHEFLSIEELLAYLGQFGAGPNHAYLSENDFENWSLASAISWAVDDWNKLPGSEIYSILTFPYKALLRDGAAGFAFQKIGTALQRERMAAGSGGVEIDDSQRAEFYLQQAERLIARYREGIAHEIQRQRVTDTFGLA